MLFAGYIYFSPSNLRISVKNKTIIRRFNSEHILGHYSITRKFNEEICGFSMNVKVLK